MISWLIFRLRCIAHMAKFARLAWRATLWGIDATDYNHPLLRKDWDALAKATGCEAALCRARGRNQ